MTCVLEASNPYPPNITWVKLDDSKKEFLPGPFLILSNVTYADGGKYRCLAENDVGGQIESRVADVNVKGMFLVSAISKDGPSFRAVSYTVRFTDICQNNDTLGLKELRYRQETYLSLPLLSGHPGSISDGNT